MTIPIYVGSDSNPAVHPAELALEHSIRSNTSADVEFHWMRAGTPPWDWHLRDGDSKATHTEFTLFRFAVPELREFKKRAIYLDVDMLVLGDIAELWALPQSAPWVCSVPKPYKKRLKHKTEVSLIDCKHFKGMKWWPTIETLKKGGTNASNLARLLNDRGFLSETIPTEWNCLDGDGYDENTKLVHFTAMDTQPWMPYPERFDYTKPHPCPEVERLWHSTYAEYVFTRAHEMTDE